MPAFSPLLWLMFCLLHSFSALQTFQQATSANSSVQQEFPFLEFKTPQRVFQPYSSNISLLNLNRVHMARDSLGEEPFTRDAVTGQGEMALSQRRVALGEILGRNSSMGGC